MKPKGGNHPFHGANLARRLAGIYRRVVLTTVLLFAALIAILLVQQYFSKRSLVLQSSADDLRDRATRVEHHLSNIAEDIVETKIWAENYLTSAAAVPAETGPVAVSGESTPGLFLKDIPPGERPYGTIIFSSEANPDDPNLVRQTDMASRLLEIQRINHYAPPNFTWSEFRSLSGFVSVYPRVEAATGKMILERPAARAMMLAFGDARRQADDWEFPRSIRWTPPYVDASGWGLMITCAAPVFDRDRLIGMVSAEMSLDFLGRFVEQPGVEDAWVLVVDREGLVLAATGTDPGQAAEVPHLDRFLPALPDSFKLAGPVPPRLGDNYIILTELKNSNWSMIKVVPERNVVRALFPEALFGALLVVLMFGFLIAADRVINRYFVNPAVGFVEFIETEAAEGAAPQPTVPPAWRQWFHRISDTLALKSVAANLPGAVFQVKADRAGNLSMTMASSGVKELLGRSPEELVSPSAFRLDFIPPAAAAELEARLRHSASESQPFAFETATRTGDHPTRWVRFILRPRRIDSGEIMWDGLMLDVSDRKAIEDELRRHRDHLEETVSLRTGELERLNAELLKEVAERTRSESALKASEERMRVMSQQMINSQESERARLSRELHDEIGQQLTAILFQLAVARNQAEIAPGEIARIERMVRDIGEDLHRICRGLQPITLTRFGLGPAIKMMLWEYNEIYGKRIEMRIEPPDYPITDEVASAAYRICQEAVTNAVRHSGAEEIQVALCRDHDSLILEVRDQGRGFDPGPSRPETELGLNGMRQRAAQCGGRLEIVTAPGEGVRVVFRVRVMDKGKGTS